MDSIEKGKLKVLIKMILIQKYPYELTARQLSDIINSYDFGFRTSINSRTIGNLINRELKKHDKHFMENITSRKEKNIRVYSITIPE